MKYLFNKKKLAVNVVSGLFALGLVAVAPQALAHDAAAQRIQILEENLRAMQTELERIKGETSQATQKVDNIEQTTNQTAQKVVNLEEKATSLNLHTDHPQRMLFFRGGFTHAMQGRNGSSIRSEVTPVGAQDQAGKDGFYVGAGIDFGLTNNVWGYMPKTSVFAELMFEYKEFGDKTQGNGALANAPSVLAGGALNARDVTVSQFTLSAAPKIKFMEGSKIRPWIIPAGLAIHVISPTSESVTYLTPGVMFGAGVDYNIWKSFFIGVDARYNLTMGKADGVRVDGMTAGGYLGIGF